MAQEIVLDWYTNSSWTTVLRFCQENELPAQALLLDNAAGHPATLAETEPFWMSMFIKRRQISFFQPMGRR